MGSTAKILCYKREMEKGTPANPFSRENSFSRMCWVGQLFPLMFDSSTRTHSYIRLPNPPPPPFFFFYKIKGHQYHFWQMINQQVWVVSAI